MTTKQKLILSGYTEVRYFGYAWVESESITVSRYKDNDGINHFIKIDLKNKVFGIR